MAQPRLKSVRRLIRNSKEAADILQTEIDWRDMHEPDPDWVPRHQRIVSEIRAAITDIEHEIAQPTAS